MAADLFVSSSNHSRIRNISILLVWWRRRCRVGDMFCDSSIPFLLYSPHNPTHILDVKVRGLRLLDKGSITHLDTGGSLMGSLHPANDGPDGWCVQFNMNGCGVGHLQILSVRKEYSINTRRLCWRWGWPITYSFKDSKFRGELSYLRKHQVSGMPALKLCKLAQHNSNFRIQWHLISFCFKLMGSWYIAKSMN